MERKELVLIGQGLGVIAGEGGSLEIGAGLGALAGKIWRIGLMGFASDYIQNKMLPRWKDSTDTFEKDRRFLYGVYLQAIRNATGNQYVAGNFLFSDQQMTVDQLWQYYFSDLAQVEFG